MKNKTTLRPKRAVIVQCRLSSTRLPGKALKNLGGKTVFEWTLSSMRRVPAEHYIVATDEDSFLELEKITKKCGWSIIKGPLQDVLERYCIAIKNCGCEVVLRATADNPFLFYEAAAALCDEFDKQNEIARCDYMTWTGLPHGSGVEVFRADSLIQAASLTNDPYDHEHVGPALYNHKNTFVSLFYKAPSRFYFPHFRTTIDTMADYRRALAVVSTLSGGRAPTEPYTTEQIVSAISDSDVHDTILFYPSVKKGHGTGHLHRSLSCAALNGAFVYIPEKPELDECAAIVTEAFRNGLNDFQVVRKMPEHHEYALIAADYFALPQEDASSLRNAASLVSIDDGGSASSYADYLIDIIPSSDDNRIVNLSNPAFIVKPLNIRDSSPKEIKKVLVSFGGEDPANLSPKAAAFIREALPEAEITVVTSKNTDEELYKKLDVTVLEPFSLLRESLFSYDLVATHYGLTSFESLSAGCAVLLFATSELHKKLSEKYGFYCVTEKELLAQPEPNFFSDVSRFIPEQIRKKICSGQENLADFLKTISHGTRYACPICQKVPEVPDFVVARTPLRTFRRCATCSMLYISWNAEKPVLYEASYFAEQYKNQYGKTYLEDFASIKNTGLVRAHRIKSILKGLGGSQPKILDVGCAYGPFLSAAGECGFLPYGTDIASDAVEYVRKKLLFPAAVASFPDFNSAESFGTEYFDALTMWYVIEHFSKLEEVLQKVSSLLKKGGIFAFSTPSAEGVSAKKNTKTFFEQSPSDHFTLWEPSKTAAILKKFGFSVEKIVSTGHHPERFPAVRQKNAKKGSILFSFYDFYSHVRNLGDTFEVYCRKL